MIVKIAHWSRVELVSEIIAPAEAPIVRDFVKGMKLGEAREVRAPDSIRLAKYDRLKITRIK